MLSLSRCSLDALYLSLFLHKIAYLFVFNSVLIANTKEIHGEEVYSRQGASNPHLSTYRPTPNCPCSPPPLDPYVCFSPAVITNKWYPISAGTTTLGTTIPSTHDWTLQELLFFKMSYFQVQYLEASVYICPSSDLTDAAKQIVLSEMSLGGFITGMLIECVQRRMNRKICA